MAHETERKISKKDLIDALEQKHATARNVIDSMSLRPLSKGVYERIVDNVKQQIGKVLQEAPEKITIKDALAITIAISRLIRSALKELVNKDPRVAQAVENIESTIHTKIQASIMTPDAVDETNAAAKEQDYLVENFRKPGVYGIPPIIMTGESPKPLELPIYEELRIDETAAYLNQEFHRGVEAKNGNDVFNAYVNYRRHAVRETAILRGVKADNPALVRKERFCRALWGHLLKVLREAEAGAPAVPHKVEAAKKPSPRFPKEIIDEIKDTELEIMMLA